MPDGRWVVIRFWQWPSVWMPWPRMPRRRIKARDVILCVLAVIMVYIVGRIAAGR